MEMVYTARGDVVDDASETGLPSPFHRKTIEKI